MSQQADARPILDHIVILVSHDTLANLPTRLKGLFTVAPGGTHADGLTSNRLILFEDGVYVELIAFFDDADPDRRKKHRWGQLSEDTIIDWAYTLHHERGFAAVQQRVENAHAGLTYSDPVAGGRTKPDGTVLKWAVAFARDRSGSPSRPGTLPFWCLDRTDRELRVPYETDRQQTQHPCGARGVCSLALSLPEKEVVAHGKVYDAIHHASSSSAGSSQSWHFDVPSGATSGKHEVRVSGSDGTSSIKLVLQGTEDSPATIELLPGLELQIEP